MNRHLFLRRVTVAVVGLWLSAGNLLAEETTPAPASKPVAVLNFASRGLGDAEWDWLSKGLADLTIGDLSSQSLRVVSREQMQEMLYEIALRQERLDPDAVAKMLKVTRYVASSYLVTRDRITLNADIIDAATGEKLHSAAVEGAARRVLELQKQLASELADVLLGQRPGTLDPAKLPQWTESLAASQLVYQGIDAYDRGEYLPAWMMFRRALRQDPKYADGLYWSGRMMYYSQEYHQAAIDLRSFALQYPRHPRVGDAVKELIDTAQQTATHPAEVLAAIDTASRLAPEAAVHNQFGTGYPSTVGVYAAGLASQILRAEGNHKSAIDRWRTAIAPFAPEHPLYWIVWHEMFALVSLQLQATGELLPLPPRPRQPDEEKFLSPGKLHPNVRFTHASWFELPMSGGDEPIWRQFVKLTPEADTITFDFAADPVGADGWGRTFTRYFYAPPGHQLQSLEVELRYKLHEGLPGPFRARHQMTVHCDRTLPFQEVDDTGVYRVVVPAEPGRRVVPLAVWCSGLSVLEWKTKAVVSPIAAEMGTLVLDCRAGRELRGTIDDVALRVPAGETKLQLPAGEHRLAVATPRHTKPVEHVFRVRAGKRVTLELSDLPDVEAHVMDTPYEPFRYGAAMGDWSGNFAEDVSVARDARGRRFLPFRSGRDLYLSQSDDGDRWSAARKLPLPINSAHDERLPILTHDGERYLLAFQSDRNAAHVHSTYVAWSEDLVDFSAPVEVDPAWMEPRSILRRADGSYLLYAFARPNGRNESPRHRSGGGPLNKILAFTSDDLVHWSPHGAVFAEPPISGLLAATRREERILAWSLSKREVKNERAPRYIIVFQDSADGVTFAKPREVASLNAWPVALSMHDLGDAMWISTSIVSEFIVFRCQLTGDVEVERRGLGSEQRTLLVDKSRVATFSLEFPYLPHELNHNNPLNRNPVWPTTDWVLGGHSVYRANAPTFKPGTPQRDWVTPSNEPDVKIAPR